MQTLKKSKINKVVFRTSDTVQVFIFGRTLNDKIESDKKRKIVQSYTFSRFQYEYVLQGIKGMRNFFSVADSNCLDCPYNEYGKCYTHKPNQYMGFRSTLRSVIRMYSDFYDIPTYNNEIKEQILKFTQNNYVRFGSYGEPSLHPKPLISAIIDSCVNWTGYTHQWQKDAEFSQFFMASTHTVEEEKIARELNYRSFIATPNKIDGIVNCPASKEAGYKSTCSKCGLCSGTMGKGKKSVYILEH